MKWIVVLAGALCLVSCSKKNYGPYSTYTPDSSNDRNRWRVPIEPPVGRPGTHLERVRQRTGYVTSTWGQDGNSGPEPKASDAVKPKKAMCIADDLNGEYAKCKDAATSAACGVMAAERKDGKIVHRCEWFGGSCKPWSYGNCTRYLPALPAPHFTKTIYLSEYRRLRSTPVRFAAEFAGYDEVQVIYTGHGPSTSDQARFALDAATHANKARVVEVVTNGCSTFASNTYAEFWLNSVFLDLHDEARDRLKKSEVALRVSGNQFSSYDENTSNHAERTSDLTQSPLTYRATVNASDAVRFSEFSYYPCRSELYESVAHLVRRCAEEDRGSGLTGKCGTPASLASEKCASATVLYPGDDRRATREHAVVAIVKSETLTPDFPTLVRVAALPVLAVPEIGGDTLPQASFAAARAFCEARGKRLPTWNEARHSIEGRNLFRYFRNTGARMGYNDGNVWSSEAPSSGAAGRRYVYRVGAFYGSVWGSAVWAVEPETSSAFYFCVAR